MTFQVKSQSENLASAMRKIGYHPIGVSDRGELNCVRPVRGDYPRFHIYSREDNNQITINLHLDQKRPSYGEGSHAHSGDYDSETVRDEAERIKSILR